MCDVFTCHMKFLKYDVTPKEKETLTPKLPSKDFYFFQFCDIVKFSIIHDKIYTNLAYTIYESKKNLKPFYISYLLKPNDEI
jgi:hypothetical protein